MKARWLFGIMAVALAVAVSGAFADDNTPTVAGDDPDGSISLSEHFGMFAHQTLREKDLPQRALQLDAALYRAAVKLNPNEPRFARSLADVLLEMNDIPGATAALKSYLALNPADQSAQVQYIDLCLASDQMQSLQQRLDYLRHLLQVQGIPDPVKSEVALRAAQLRMQKGQQDEAMKLLDTARQLNPLNLKALRIRYVMTQEKALPVDRVTQLLALLQANPADPVVCSRLAEQLAQLGLVDAAMAWYGQANVLYAATNVRADPAFVLGASSELLIAKKADTASMLADRYNQSVPDDADGWFVTLSIIKFQLAQYADDAQAKAKNSTTQMLAANALANRIIRIRTLAGDTSATTRPIDSPDMTRLPDLSDDAIWVKIQKYRQLVGPYLASLSDLAWLHLYYRGDTESAAPLIDDLQRLAPPGDETVKRLRAWQKYIAGDSKTALTELKALESQDPLAGLGVVLIELKDPNTKPQAIVHAQKLLNDHPSGVVGAVFWAEFSRLGLKVEPSEASGAVATLVQNVPDTFMQLVQDPRNFYDVQVTPLKPTFGFGEPVLVRVTLQNMSNADLAIGDDCAVHPTLWFDARFRGMMDAGVFGAAVGRLDQRLVLAPGDVVGTIVRIDQDALQQVFSGDPSRDLLLDLSLVMNPIGIAANKKMGTAQAQPGVCGYAAPSTELIARSPVPIVREEQRAALYERLNIDDGGEKIRAVQAIATYIQLLKKNKSPDAPKMQAEFTTHLHRVDPGGREPVAAFLAFELAGISDGDDQVNQVTTMTVDTHWLTRLMGLVACNDLGNGGIGIASKLTNDPDPIVKEYAVALATSLQAAATTQPSTPTPPPQTSQTP
jgi:tetratricopeptide (TPR) repeat protein